MGEGKEFKREAGMDRERPNEEGKRGGKNAKSKSSGGMRKRKEGMGQN